MLWRRAICTAVVCTIALGQGMAAENGPKPQDKPIVGLAGFRYVRWYAKFVEAIDAQYAFLTPRDLQSAEGLKRCRAVIVCRQDDPDAPAAGLSPAASKALAQYVREGGRVLLSYGAGPPADVLPGSFGRASRGGHLVVTSTQHPITAAYRVGDHLAYGAAHFLISDLPESAEPLLRWHTGPAALVAARHGEGEVVYSALAFALAGSGRGDLAALLLRTLRHLVYGSPDRPTGNALSSDRPTTPAPLHTPRQLSAPTAAEARWTFSERWTRTTDGFTVRSSPQELVLKPNRPCRLGPWGSMTRTEACEAPHGLVVALPIHAPAEARGAFVSCEARWVLADGSVHVATLPRSPFVMDQPGPHRLLCRLGPQPDGARLRVTIRFSLAAGRLVIGAATVRPLPDLDALFSSGDALPAAARPSCFATPERLRTWREWIASGNPGQLGVSPESLLRPVVGLARRAVKNDSEMVKGTRVVMPPKEFVRFKGLLSTHASMAMERHMRALAVAYAATGEAAFGQRCREYLLGLAQWPQWPMERLAFGVAPAYDLAYDRLEPDERRQVRDALVRCVLRPGAERFWGVGLTSDHNGTVVPAAAFTVAALAGGHELPGSAACAAVAEDLMVEFMDHRWNTGSHEGPGYDAYTLTHVAAALMALRNRLGVDHFGHPYLKQAMDMTAAFLAPSRRGVVGFGDVGYTCWEAVAAAVGAATHDGTAGWFASESLHFKRYHSLRLLYWDPNAAKAPDSRPLSAVFPKHGQAALRSDLSQAGTLMAFLCSSVPHGHIHLAQNHFRLLRGDQELACSPGYSSNIKGAAGRYARGTPGHNTVTVEGAGQTARRGVLREWFTSPCVDYVVGDATEAYGTGTLSRFRRHIVFIKPDTFVMVDDLRGPGQPRRFEWRYHPEKAGAPATITLAGETLGQERMVGRGPIVSKRGDQQVTVQFLAPSPVEVIGQPCPFAERQGRELIVTGPRAQRQVFVTLLTLNPPRDAAEVRALPFVAAEAVRDARLLRDGSDGVVALEFGGPTPGALVLRLDPGPPASAPALRTDAALALRLRSLWPDGHERELWLVHNGASAADESGRALRLPTKASAAALRTGDQWQTWPQGAQVKLPDAEAR